MPKWYMLCNGQAGDLTSDLVPANPRDRRKLEKTKITVCGRCWRSRTWEY